MKDTGTLFLYISLLFIYTNTLQAQPSFISPSLSIDPGTSFYSEIKVTSFSYIIGTQFTMSWDPAVVRFKEILNLNQVLELTNDNNFGINDSESGILSFQWYDESLNGVNLADSATLFSIKFEAIGAPNESTNVAFTDDPTVREVADTSFEAIPAAYHPGIISILGPTSVQVLSITDDLQMTEAFPNPFLERTNIELRLKQPLQLHIIIFNEEGRALYEKAGNYQTGSHILQFSKDIFPEAGIYYVKLAAENYSRTQKLILVQ